MSEVETVGKKPGLLRRLLASVLRLGGLLVLIMCATACFVMQPTCSNRPATLCANPERLKEDVRTLSESIGTRQYDQPDKLAECRSFLVGKFRDAGARTEEQTYRIRDREFKNVRAFFGPENAPRIVVGAHYDTCYEGDNVHNTGADDNASGVAGLIELAQLLSKKRPANTTVELVAYCTEEPPYFASDDMGSYRHAELLKKENAVVKGAIILEMIGYFSDAPNSQRYPVAAMKLFYPSTGNFISLVGGVGDRDLLATTKKAMRGSAPLPVYSSCIPRSLDFVHLSDHRNYWKFDYPAIMVSDTAFYRNDNYHRSTDTWQTLDYTRMAHAVTQVHQAVLKLGE